MHKLGGKGWNMGCCITIGCCITVTVRRQAAAQSTFQSTGTSHTKCPIKIFLFTEIDHPHSGMVDPHFSAQLSKLQLSPALGLHWTHLIIVICGRFTSHFSLSIGEDVRNPGTSELRICLCQHILVLLRPRPATAVTAWADALVSVQLYLSNCAKVQLGKPPLN